MFYLKMLTGEVFFIKSLNENGNTYTSSPRDTYQVQLLPMGPSSASIVSMRMDDSDNPFTPQGDITFFREGICMMHEIKDSPTVKKIISEADAHVSGIKIASSSPIGTSILGVK